MGGVHIAGDCQGAVGVESAEIGTDSSLAGVTIGGSLIGVGKSSGRIFSTGAMGPVRVAGNVQGAGGQDSGEIRSDNTLAGVTIGGSLVGGGGVGGGGRF